MEGGIEEFGGYVLPLPRNRRLPHQMALGQRLVLELGILVVFNTDLIPSPGL